MRSKIILGVIGITVVLTSIAITAMAATGGNYARTWETLLGAKRHGYVQIQASYNDYGRHAKQGYQRFMREAGPSLDTGRLYTSTAYSPSDPTIRWREDWVWDSPLWGDKYTTKWYYRFLYF
ncbi:MAG: hypothetical protein WAQ32_05095 [Dethiobacteria bacterium]|jgi:hypothetical protein|nr:hypothetical protein [Bacillota bacterium]